MNAHCERFNRSIQDSFVDYYEDLLFTDLALFNQKMSDWLVFYNTELPHLSTKPNPKKTTSLTNLPVTPVEFLLQSHPQSRMYWTNTFDWFFTELGNTVSIVSELINDLSRFDSEHWFEKVILRTTSHYD